MVSSSPTMIQNLPTREKKFPWRKTIWWVIYLISIAILAWYFAKGYSYYMTPFAQRPHHPQYGQLRPAGNLGLAFGIAGSAMMILMLIYSLRKRTRLLGRFLPLQNLLEFHIYLGIMGPLLIVLHTSFKVQGLVAVSFWSMVAVALSGFFGRYLYLQIPRNIQGNELSLQEIDQMNNYLAHELRSNFALDDETFRRVDAICDASVQIGAGTVSAIMSLLRDDIFRPIAQRKLARSLSSALPFSSAQLQSFLEISFERVQVKRRIAAMARVQQLFHYWHVIHKPFAIIMYIIMCIHIGVAVWTGYAWIH